jgi:hypothetical protein
MENCKVNKTMKQLIVYGANGVGDVVTDESDSNYGKYKMPVIQRGTNLIDVNKFKNGNFKINDDGSCTLSWILSGRFSAYNTDLGHIPSGSTLVFKASIVEATTRYKEVLIQLTYTNGTAKYYSCKNSTTITLENTIKQIGLYIHNSEEKGSYITFKDFGLYYQNEYIGYEPFVQPFTSNVFLSNPLYNDGSYVDFKYKKAYYADGIASFEDLDIKLPKLTANRCVIEVGTSVKPQSIYGKYIKR